MRLRFWLGTALAAVLLVVGVQGVAQATSGSVANKPLAFTAAEYFDGIYFGVGPVADRVPQLHASGRSGDPAGVAEAAAELRAHIEAESSQFLAGFAAAMVSGDQVVVRAALTDGAEWLANARQAISAADADQAQSVTPTGDVTYILNWIVTWRYEAVFAQHVEPLRADSTDLRLDEAAEVIATQLAVR